MIELEKICAKCGKPFIAVFSDEVIATIGGDRLRLIRFVCGECSATRGRKVIQQVQRLPYRDD